MTQKQERFIQEYTQCFNGSEAVKRAGYDSAHPGQIAFKLLKNKRILARIEIVKAQIAQCSVMKRDEWLAEINRLAQGRHVPSAIKALELIGKAQGYFAPEKTEITTAIDQMTEAELIRIASGVAGK